MIDFKKDDVIVLAKAESAPMVEHIVKVKDLQTIHGQTIILSDKVITLIKQMGPSGVSVSPIPNFGLISTMDRLTGDKSDITINLSNFDFVSTCTDPEIIKQLDEANSGIITDVSPQTGSEEFNGLHLV